MPNRFVYGYGVSCSCVNATYRYLIAFRIASYCSKTSAYRVSEFNALVYCSDVNELLIHLFVVSWIKPGVCEPGSCNCFWTAN